MVAPNPNLPHKSILKISMRKKDLDREQKDQISYFIQFLSNEGWTFDNWQAKFEANKNVWPEVVAIYTKPGIRIGLGFCPLNQFLSLIVSEDPGIYFKEYLIYFNNDINALLKSINTLKQNLNMFNSFEILKNRFLSKYKILHTESQFYVDRSEVKFIELE